MTRKCATREIIYHRPLGGVNGAKKGVLPDITLQEGDVARERAAGQWARLLRGEKHKDFDALIKSFHVIFFFEEF